MKNLHPVFNCIDTRHQCDEFIDPFFFIVLMDDAVQRDVPIDHPNPQVPDSQGGVLEQIRSDLLIHLDTPAHVRHDMNIVLDGLGSVGRHGKQFRLSPLISSLHGSAQLHGAMIDSHSDMIQVEQGISFHLGLQGGLDPPITRRSRQIWSV